jgi:hypothetical protein
MPVLRIEGNASGYWPTPQTRGFTNDGDLQALNRMCADYGEMSGMAYRANQKKKQSHWTPANTPSGNWPTPTCADAFTDKLKSSQQSEGSMHSVNLSQAVKMWPTPTAQPSGGDAESFLRRKGRKPDGAITDLGAAVGGGGQLNPDWVEWLMNWPIGWTSMEPLNPDRFRAWLRASPSVPTASSASGMDKCHPPQS